MHGRVLPPTPVDAAAQPAAAHHTTDASKRVAWSSHVNQGSKVVRLVSTISMSSNSREAVDSILNARYCEGCVAHGGD